MNGIKPLRWIASAKDDLSAMPTEVRRAVGYALFAAQQGEMHADAKVLKGFGDAGVLEVVARHDGDTFRAVYTVRLAGVVYVRAKSSRRSRSAASRHRRRSWT
jgi:phage-related protein